MKSYLHYLFSAVMVVAIYACEDCEPSVQPENTVSIALYDQNNRADEVEVFFDSVYGLSNFDSALLDSATITADQTFLLPLNRQTDSSTFVFSYLDTLEVPDDTLTIAYTRFVEINGPDCSTYTTIGNLRTAYTTFDSVQFYISFIGQEREIPEGEEEDRGVDIVIYLDPDKAKLTGDE